MDTVVCDLALLERWLTGWSRSRGLPLPVQERGGLHVEVGWHDQVRRHVFVDAGSALQACAAGVREHFVQIKATVSSEQLLRTLPSGWTAEAPRYLMSHAGPMCAASALAPEYSIVSLNEHGADVLYIVDARGDVAATGRITQNAGTAVFDRIETAATHRRQGLASALMLALDGLASEAGATERLLVATEAGAHLYRHLGWQLLAPWSTAVFTGHRLPGSETVS
ncbi:MAG: GNAT family N-acetyltransferase [Pseudomonadota bacterium]|nr:GNAT family N-acetyltransferase [Pseudomonadota bacterium]